MNRLELRVPPVAVAFLTALLMWLVAWSLPAGAFVVPARILFAMTLATIGAATSTLGVVAFRRASTTVNPTKPEAASSLVHSGIYTVLVHSGIYTVKSDVFRLSVDPRRMSAL